MEFLWLKWRQEAQSSLDLASLCLRIHRKPFINHWPKSPLTWICGQKPYYSHAWTLERKIWAHSPYSVVGQGCPGILGIWIVVAHSGRWNSKLKATNGKLENKIAPPANVGYPISQVMKLGKICRALIGCPSHVPAHQPLNTPWGNTSLSQRKKSRRTGCPIVMVA